MSLRPRTPLPFRLAGALGAYALAAYIATAGRSWDRPPAPARRRSTLRNFAICVCLFSALALIDCSSVRRWVHFALPGRVTYGAESGAGDAAVRTVYVVVGRRTLAVDVDRSIYLRLRRGMMVTVTGELSGDDVRHVAIFLPGGVKA